MKKIKLALLVAALLVAAVLVSTPLPAVLMFAYNAWTMNQ